MPQIQMVAPVLFSSVTMFRLGEHIMREIRWKTLARPNQLSMSRALDTVLEPTSDGLEWMMGQPNLGSRCSEVGRCQVWGKATRTDVSVQYRELGKGKEIVDDKGV